MKERQIKHSNVDKNTWQIPRRLDPKKRGGDDDEGEDIDDGDDDDEYGDGEKRQERSN